jgi:hypothetical protein
MIHCYVKTNVKWLLKALVFLGHMKRIPFMEQLARVDTSVIRVSRIFISPLGQWLRALICCAIVKKTLFSR